MLSPRLVAAVDSVETTAYQGFVYRHQAAKWNPLSGAGARSHGGRWNPPNSFSTLYLAMSRETAVDEFHRMAARTQRAPEDFLPRRLYRYEARLIRLLDLRDREARAAISLDDDDLTSDDPTVCQSIGESAHYLGVEGIIAPSATGSGTVLSVYFDLLEPDSVVQPLDFETWEAPPSI